MNPVSRRFLPLAAVLLLGTALGGCNTLTRLSQVGEEPPLIPPRVAVRPKKIRPHVVVEPGHLPPLPTEMFDNFRADEAGGTGDEEFLQRGWCPRNKVARAFRPC